MRSKILFFVGFLGCLSLAGYCDNVVKDFYLSNYEQGGTAADWEVKGNQAIIQDQNVSISNMAAKYYSPDDTVTVTSDKARLNKQSMNLVLKKNVKITDQNGATLTTDKLNWNKNKNLVHTQEEVHISKDNMKIKAQGMQADTALKTVDFKKDVTAQFITADIKGPVTITCDGPLDIEYNSGKAVFNKNVVVEYELGTLKADKATAYFDTKQKAIDRVVCEGNVVIIKEDNTTYAQKATYIHSEGRAFLEGRPRLVYHPKKSKGSVF